MAQEPTALQASSRPRLMREPAALTRLTPVFVAPLPTSTQQHHYTTCSLHLKTALQPLTGRGRPDLIGAICNQSTSKMSQSRVLLHTLSLGVP